jgi:hypothetical protein
MQQKINRCIKKQSVIIVFGFLLLSIVCIGIVSGIDYSANNFWSFGDGSYFCFKDNVSLDNAPSYGKPYPIGLMGYWALDEINGSIAPDLYGNNGVISGANWVKGKYGSALGFDGVNDYLNISSSGLNLTDGFTIDLWIKLNAPLNGSSWIGIFGKRPGWVPVSGIGGAYNNIYFGITTTNGTSFLIMPQGTIDVWQHIVATYSRNASFNNLKLYRDGVLLSKGNLTGSIINTADPWLMGKGYLFFNGSVDDVQIYSRALTENEVALMSTIGDPNSFANYYSFQDSVSNNTLLIRVENSAAYDNTLVTCYNFFTNKQLVFNTNNSANINVWTNLGKPVFTTGHWIDENYTTTVLFDNASSGILDWNPGIPPSASNYSISSTNAGNVTTFSVLWTDNISLSSGGYIFGTNNTGQWVNSTWAAFTSNPGWGNVTLTLNGIIGANVSFREYANNTLGFWSASDIYTIRTSPSYSPTPSPTPTPKPTPIPTPTALPFSTVIPTTTTKPASTPPVDTTSIPTPTPILNTLTTGTLTEQNIIVVSAISVILFFVICLIFIKKGIMKIEIENEQTAEDSITQEDYQI